MKRLMEKFERTIMLSVVVLVILPILVIAVYNSSGDKSFLSSGICSMISYVLAMIATAYISKKEIIYCSGGGAFILGIIIFSVFSTHWIGFIGTFLSGTSLLFECYCYLIKKEEKKHG